MHVRQPPTRRLSNNSGSSRSRTSLSLASRQAFRTEIADFLHLADRRRRPARQAELAPRSIDETIWLLASGRAICLGPASLADVFARPGIVSIPLIDAEPVKIALARHADDHRAAVRAFVRLARDHFHATRLDKHPADTGTSAAASS